MHSRWTTLIIALLSLFIIVIGVGQVFFAGGKELTTETALSYSMEEEVPFEGVYMRDETLIYSSGNGVISYEHADGSKVGKSSVIARRYKSESEVEYRREIEELTGQIQVLENAEKLIGTDNSQLEVISSQINEQHSKLVSLILDGDYSAAVEAQNGMLEALCKREITLKESDGYSEKISELESRISQLEARLSGDVTNVYADGTGYFVSNVDGYEGEVTLYDTEGMTAKRIQSIIEDPDKSRGNAVGKLISGYTWRVAAVIDKENLFGINAGTDVTLRVGSEGMLIDAEVVSVTDNGDGTAVYIFECDRLTSEVVSGRTARFKLVINSYGGLRVNRDAIYYNDEGERGVYIVRGTSLAFKKINVIYWGEGYVICSQEGGDDYLKLYDRIVTEGKDLYDGKVVE